MLPEPAQCSPTESKATVKWRGRKDSCYFTHNYFQNLIACNSEDIVFTFRSVGINVFKIHILLFFTHPILSPQTRHERLSLLKGAAWGIEAKKELPHLAAQTRFNSGGENPLPQIG